MNVNSLNTLNRVHHQLMTLNQNMCQTDKCFSLQQQQTVSHFNTVKVSATSVFKLNTTVTSDVITSVTVCSHVLDFICLLNTDVAHFQKEEQCFKCDQQDYMKNDYLKNNSQIKNIEAEESSEKNIFQRSSKNTQIWQNSLFRLLSIWLSILLSYFMSFLHKRLLQCLVL